MVELSIKLILFAANFAFNHGSGGAIYQTHSSKIFFRKNAVVNFIKNHVDKLMGFGGAICSTGYSLISFEDQSVVTFVNNSGSSGGALCVGSYSNIIFNSNSKRPFNNSGTRGEAPCAVDDSVMSCGNTSTVTFTGNNAEYEGGAISAGNYNITFLGHSVVTFTVEMMFIFKEELLKY